MKASPLPKVSVIMSVTSGMPYLKEAVQSILSQTHKNFEFIIVDDASTDSSWQYLKSLKDKRIKLIKNKRNLGLAASLNKALKVAKGEFIARMDADDISLPQRLEKQIEFLKKNPTISLCGTWADLIDDKGNKIGEKRHPTDPKRVKEAINWYTAVIHPTYMGTPDFFRQLKGYRDDFDFAEDYDLLSRAKNRFKIANIDQKLLLWRLQGTRRSRASMQKIDKAELKIKLESIKRDGLTPQSLVALVKKIIMTYLLPYPLKLRLATFLKQA